MLSSSAFQAFPVKKKKKQLMHADVVPTHTAVNGKDS